MRWKMIKGRSVDIRWTMTITWDLKVFLANHLFV